MIEYQDMVSKDNLPELLSISEASKVLHTHPNTLRAWDRKGILKAVRFGPRKDRRYKKSDILVLIDQKIKT